jgi:pheromone shutdown protein TraB
VIRAIQPGFVVLELCEGRVDNLLEIDLDEEASKVTLSQVVRTSLRERSVKTFGMGLLSWMQLKAAKVMGSKLGAELIMAAKEAHSVGATIVLGDRLYGVTIQRVFDKLGWVEKLKMAVIVLWEVVTMSFFRIKEYIRKTEDDSEFVKDEIARFSKHLPAIAQVIISERDEYIAQSLCEIAAVGFRQGRGWAPTGRCAIVAVVGAGHLVGIQKHLAAGGVTLDRINEISSSSKQGTTWPGKGMLQVVNPDILFSKHN